MKLKNFKSVFFKHLEYLSNRNYHLARIQEFQVTERWGLWPDRSKNPLTRNPARYWSQSDEDSITLEIFKRLGVERGQFIEIGCGNGLENNTLVLLSQGWRGGWVDGCELSFDLPSNSRVKHKRGWVKKSNVLEFISAVSFQDLDNKYNYLSLDLDGNDYHVLECLLESNITVDVFVVEYNARFPNKTEWVMPYKDNHTWGGDDYFGASLFSFQKLFSKFEYSLVACSVQGSNAFFVRNDLMQLFSDVPRDFEELYQPPLYYLVHDWAQKASPRTVRKLVSE